MRGVSAERFPGGTPRQPLNDFQIGLLDIDKLLVGLGVDFVQDLNIYAGQWLFGVWWKARWAVNILLDCNFQTLSGCELPESSLALWDLGGTGCLFRYCCHFVRASVHVVGLFPGTSHVASAPPSATVTSHLDSRHRVALRPVQSKLDAFDWNNLPLKTPQPVHSGNNPPD